MIRTTLLAASMVLAAACQASAGAQVDARTNADVDVAADAQFNPTEHAQATATQAPPSAQMALAATSTEASGTEAMLGARQGMHPKDPPSLKANCKCLKVAVGNPSDPVFTWDGPASQTNPDTQLALGLTSEGLNCPEAAQDSLGASYHGYQVSGSDVVVEVETARLGRPIIRGAIIPRPQGGGRVLVRAVDPSSPYGRSLDGASRQCVVWAAH